MFAFLSENLGTIAVSLVLAALMALAIARLVKQKKRGGCAGCAGGCDGCHLQDGCKPGAGPT
ncbi:MAG: FeoB-associated Cys-rich membrane protein [Clostridiales bacterium]|nr:FeoB-associated Cys-rich membrane protein [Clostridiales bacterium]